MENTNKYFIVDSGKYMTDYADMIMVSLKAKGHHFINYLTDQDFYLAVEEVDEDTFLDHYKHYINTNA